MKLSRAFHKISKVKGNIRIIQGAGGSSKTYSILQYLIILASKTEKELTISICSESFPHLRRGAMKDFMDIIKGAGIYTEANHNKTNHQYTINNCKFEFFGVEDASKLRGARRDILFLNEANNLSHEAFSQLFIRTRMFCFLDFNPSHLAWIRDYIEDDNSNFIKLTYQDNEFLAQTVIDYYLKAIKKAEQGSNYWMNFVKVFVWGEEGVVMGAIFGDYVKGDKLPQGAKYLGAGMDFGFSNDPSAIVKVYRYDGKIYLVESLYQKGLLNSQIAKHIADDVELRDNVIVCDSSEPKTIAEMRSYRLHVMPVKKGKGSIIAGLQIMQEYELIVLGENLNREFQQYCYQKDKDGNSIGIPIDNFNHGIDGARYFFMERLAKAATSTNNTLRFV